MKFSGSTYVTSNKYFTEISGIQDELLLLASGIDSSPSHKEGLLEDMARGMKKKYDKYWGKLEDINGNLFIAVVLDPRYKMGYLKHALRVYIIKTNVMRSWVKLKMI